MEAIALVYVMVGGAVGSLLRYVAGMLITRVNPSEFPLGTLCINILGSCMMGVWIGVVALILKDKARELHLLIAIGFLGGFTTFSTFSLDIFYLFDRAAYGQLVLYIGGSVILSVLALVGGMVLVKLVTP